MQTKAMNPEIENNKDIVSNGVKTPFSKATNSKDDSKKPADAVIELKNNRFYYSVASFNILLEKDIKAENLSNPHVYALPHSPAWCSGIVNVRGNIIPVLNMHTFLKTGIKVPINKSKLLLFKHSNMTPIVFQIDKLPAMIDFDDYAIATNSVDLPQWINKSFKEGSNLIHEVDHSNLLNLLNN